MNFAEIEVTKSMHYIVSKKKVAWTSQLESSITHMLSRCFSNIKIKIRNKV